ncbi:MAG: hypothetical protein WBA10_07305 [Elainellaceae cyanobacterium]
MADILIEIQGSDAVAATEEMLAIDGLSGEYEVEGEDEKEGILVAIATIVGIVGGTLTIAEKLYQWYQAARKARSPSAPARVEKAILVGRNGRRLLLKDATVEQIQKILDA